MSELIGYAGRFSCDGVPMGRLARWKRDQTVEPREYHCFGIIPFDIHSTNQDRGAKLVKGGFLVADFQVDERVPLAILRVECSVKELEKRDHPDRSVSFAATLVQLSPDPTPLLTEIDHQTARARSGGARGSGTMAVPSECPPCPDTCSPSC